MKTPKPNVKKEAEIIRLLRPKMSIGEVALLLAIRHQIPLVVVKTGDRHAVSLS